MSRDDRGPPIEVIDSEDGGSGAAAAPFAFEEIERQWTWQSSRKGRDLFAKWNLTPGLRMRCFRATTAGGRRGRFRPTEETTAIRRLLADASVASALGLPPSPGGNRRGDDEVDVRPLSCRVLSMNFMEPLYREGIISDTNHIRGCMDRDVDGIIVQDKLRDLLVNPESESGSVFSADEKEEFVYHLLRLVCAGGSMCQAEEKFDEWKEATKAMYRDLLVVRRDTKGGGGIEVTSSVYWIDPEGRNAALFPRASIHNKCFAVVDREKRTVKIVYKPFEPFW